MKTIRQQNATPDFSLTICMLAAALAFLLLPEAGLVTEQVNQFLAEVLSACKEKMSKCYGL